MGYFRENDLADEKLGKKLFHSVTLTKEYYLEEETSGNFDTDMSKGYEQINHRSYQWKWKDAQKKGGSRWLKENSNGILLHTTAFNSPN